MNRRQVMRIATGANLLAGCLLLQGCGLFGKKGGTAPAETIPEETKAQPVEVQPATTTPAVQAAPVQTEPIDLPSIPMSTAYTVRKGDTISAIAARYGLRWQDVLAVNPGLSPNKLRVGQVIQLPGRVDTGKPHYVLPATAPKHTAAVKHTTSKPAPVVSGKETVYTVKSGDSLSRIASKHGVKIADLKAANGLKSDRLSIGQKLKVPASSKKVAAAAPAVKHTAKPANTAAPKISTKPGAKPAEVKSAVTNTAPAKPTTPAETAKPAETKPAETAKPAEPANPPAVTPAPAENGAAAVPATPAANNDVYTVKEGEDLYAVALRWGCTPSDLRTLNNLPASSVELKPGQTLKIPARQN
jgi:LysM repeat protein